MATLTLTQASAGAPTLSGTNGALCAVLDWALVQNGWAIEYTATNKRIYRAGTGNRRRLFVAHDSTLSGSAALAVLRGCEDATAANEANLTDPFPTVAQLSNANSNVAVSNAANATARDYVITVSPTHVIFSCSTQSTASNAWDTFIFGDLAGTEAGDTWATVMMVGASTAFNATTARAVSKAGGPGISPSTAVYLCRSIDGSIKSTYANIHQFGANSTIGGLSGATTARAGYGNRVLRQRAAVNCAGSSTAVSGALHVYQRGWIPNFWVPLHSAIGTLTGDDTFGDTAYHASAVFRPVIAGSGVWHILETSDTWSLP